LAQVCRITRERIVRGKKTSETVYAITSHTAEQAGPAELLALSRAHWGIENKLHYVRDVTCREDQARAHAGHAPQVLAAFATPHSRSSDGLAIRSLRISSTSPSTAWRQSRQSRPSEGREPNDPAVLDLRHCVP
jgi:hypothetical protein